MKILLVEDNADLRELLELSLARQKFIVDSAADGDTAFAKAKENVYDLIILDLTLPGKSGFEIITSLRSLQIKVPILVISGRMAIEDRIHALNLGADDYLVKDFSHQELSARVKSLIRRSKGDSKNIYTCGSLSVNLSDFTVRRSGQPIYLTKIEFILLTELIRRRGKTTAKEILIQAAWGDEFGPNPDNKLNVHIKALREKIDGPFKDKLLQTHRGFGYRLEDPNG